MEQSSSNEQRVVAALGYPIWIVALIVLFTDMRHNRFVRTHAIQALGYAVAWFVVFVALNVLLGWGVVFLQPLLWLAWLVLSLYYAYRAYQGELFTIPVVSQFTAKYVG
jgi:uncharacterized membrane protein